MFKFEELNDLDDTAGASISYQKEVALKILDHFKGQSCYNGFLAGGAPRNWYFNEKAKDLDFFIQVPRNDVYTKTHDTNEKYLFHVYSLLLPYHGEFKEVKEAYDDEKSHPDIIGVVDFNYEGVDCQLVVGYNDINTVIGNFGLSINQIMWNGEYLPTKHFEYSAKNKVIYDTGIIESRSAWRIQKVLLYFPNFEYRGAREIEKWCGTDLV